MKYEIKNLDELNKFAKKFISKLKGTETICLSGDLGAGKTAFTKELFKELGCIQNVTSPTFNILKIYDSPLCPLYHIDAYRLEGIGYDQVLDDYLFDDNAIKVVEWYNFLDESLFNNPIKIDVIKNKDDSRIYSVEGICLD